MARPTFAGRAKEARDSVPPPRGQQASSGPDTEPEEDDTGDVQGERPLDNDTGNSAATATDTEPEAVPKPKRRQRRGSSNPDIIETDAASTGSNGRGSNAGGNLAIPDDLSNALSSIKGTILDQQGTIEDINTSMVAVPYAYLAFFSSMSPNASQLRMKIPSMNDGDVYLQVPDEEPVKIPMPFKFAYIDGFQCWVHQEGDGSVTDFMDKTTHGDDVEKKARAAGKYWKEWIESVILLYLPQRAYLARCSWRSTKTPAAKVGIETHNSVLSKHWGEMSEAHMATLKLPQPWMRYFVEVMTSKRKGQHVYITTEGIAKPAGFEQWSKIGALLKSPDFADQVEMLSNDLDARYDELAQAGKRGK